jgi:hypothetical protein
MPSQACEDGDGCTLNDSCDDAGTCLPGDWDVVNCGCADDSTCSNLDDQCNLGRCDVDTHTCYAEALEGQNCEDGDLCTEADSCQPDGSCWGAPKDCDDEIVCTQDSCNPDTGFCSSVPMNELCDDDNSCTLDLCDLAMGGCDYNVAGDGDACGQGDSCVGNARCYGGYCYGQPVTCDDDSMCTSDYCDPDLGCFSTAWSNQQVLHFNSVCAVLPGVFHNNVFAGQMTVEFWYKGESPDWVGTIIDMCDGPVVAGPGFVLDTIGIIGLPYSETGIMQSGPPASATWQHIAFVRVDTELYIFVNGELFDMAFSFPDGVTLALVDITLGCEFDETTGSYINSLVDGWIDELRFSNVARYLPGDSFTPNAYNEVDFYTVGLYHFDGDFKDASGNNEDGYSVFGPAIFEPADAGLCQ